MSPKAPAQPIRILLVEDHFIIKEALSALWAQHQDIKMVAYAKTGKGALQQVRQHTFDVMLLDANLPDITGMEVARKCVIQQPNIRIVILTATTGTVIAQHFLNLGVYAYLTKHEPHDVLLSAIRSVAQGQRYLSPTLATQLAWSKYMDRTPFDALTRREMEMLFLLMNTPTQQLSQQLHLHAKTLYAYRYRIYKKLNVNNQIELIQLAQQHQLLEPGKYLDQQLIE